MGGIVMDDSLSRIKAILENYEYRVLSCAMTDQIEQDNRIGSTFKVLWSRLQKMVNFDDDWSIQISNADLGKTIGKSLWTIRRGLAAFKKYGYARVEYISGKISKIYIRFPVEFLDKIEKEAKPRRRSKLATPSKIALRPEPHSYYLYYTNNNKPVEPVAEPQAQVAVPSPDVVAEIERLEKKKAELDNKYTELSKESAKHPEKLKEVYEIQRKISPMINSIDREIDKLRPSTPSKRPSVFKPTASAQIICDFGKLKLKNSLNHFADRDKLVKEITFMIERRNLGDGNPMRGVNAGLKLVRGGEWRTPRGMRQ